MDPIRAEANSSIGEERARLVEEISRALEGAGELQSVLQTAMRFLVPKLGDMAVLILEEATVGPHIEVAHVRPSSGARLRREVTAALSSIRDAAEGNSREGRQFRWIPVVTDTSARLVTRGDPRLAGLLRSFEVRSLLVVPLRAGGRPLGGLALARTESGDAYHANDLATAQVVARRIALAADSAMLQHTLQREIDRGPRAGEAYRKWIRVFDLAWWGAAIVDAHDFRMDTVNPAFARLHGYADPASLAGRLFADLLPADRVSELDEWRGGGTSRPYESVHVRADGVPVPVLVSVTSIDFGAEPDSYVVTVQDLTDLKRAEERLRRAQRMEAVGRLAGGVAHEVNNMMTIILGFSDLMSRGIAMGEDRQRELEEIRKAAIRAAKITTQLLAFSRQQVLQPTDLRLNQVIGEIVPVLRLMLPANVAVETSLSPHDGAVRADRSQLEQVLINLAFNARDAMVSGGTIRITTDTRRLNEAEGRRLIGIPIPRGRYWLVTVQDTGHGMDPATVAQVFEPFFTTKPAGSGTGLGLATVYGIVKQSGGYVWVESSPGSGTSFTICLPQVSGAEPDAVEQSPERPVEAAAVGTILILEDEDGVRELAARILRERGYRTTEAKNGGEALALLSEAGVRPDLLLTDVIVPDMGTGELEQAVHRLHPQLPILYMSGYPRDDILARGLLRENQPFLQKPFTSEHLTRGVAEILRHG